MKRQPTKCWFCGSANLTDRGDCNVCNDCRATDGIPPSPGSSPLTYAPGVRGGGKGQGELPRFRPSVKATRAAAKARGDKKD